MHEVLNLLLFHVKSFKKLTSTNILPTIINIDGLTSSDENELVTILEVIFRILKALLNLTVGRYYLLSLYALSFSSLS